MQLPRALENLRNRMRAIKERQIELSTDLAHLRLELREIQQQYDDPVYAAHLRTLIVAKFGSVPPLERFSVESCRLWFRCAWHMRSGIETNQQISVHGFSETDCLEKLVQLIETTSHIAQGQSCKECDDLGVDY